MSLGPSVYIVSGPYGNRRALENMLRRCDGAPALLAKFVETLPTHIIICGVGAFDQGMGLIRQNLIKLPITSLLEEGKIPVLGICLGMQMLGKGSEEGSLPGLGWIPARCRHLGGLGMGVVPHVGWETLNILKPDPLLAGLDEGARFYFSHSYGMDGVPPECLLATPARGPDFAAVVRKGNAWGVQFHPEKSLRHGLRILTNFLNFRP